MLHHSLILPLPHTCLLLVLQAAHQITRLLRLPTFHTLRFQAFLISSHLPRKDLECSELKKAALKSDALSAMDCLPHQDAPDDPSSPLPDLN